VVDIRPGTYTITFTLAGFNTLRREAVEVPTSTTVPIISDILHYSDYYQPGIRADRGTPEWFSRVSHFNISTNFRTVAGQLEQLIVPNQDTEATSLTDVTWRRPARATNRGGISSTLASAARSGSTRHR